MRATSLSKSEPGATGTSLTPRGQQQIAAAELRHNPLTDYRGLVAPGSRSCGESVNGDILSIDDVERLRAVRTTTP